MTTSSQLTYFGVFLAVFANQVCLPIPSIFVLMAAGALSARGEMRTSVIVLLSVFACLVADGIWFWFGRRWGSSAMRLLSRFGTDPKSCSNTAQDNFRRHGIRVLCVAKFLPGLDGVLPPLAGAQGASLSSFLAFDTVGSFLWSGIYVGLGYTFCNELEIAIHWVERFGTVLGIAIGVPIAVYACLRGITLLRMIRRLRLRRVSPPMLARKLKSDSKVAVLDLSNFEAEREGESVEAIPGAFGLDPARLRRSPHISVPNDVDIVLYSSAGSDSVSARAAVALNRIGVDNVLVLEGGLKAWREQGFPVAGSLETPEVVAQRLGVRLPHP